MIKNFNQKIEELFEKPFDPQRAQSLEEIKTKFILSEDNKQIENLSYVFASTVGKNEIPLLFSQLASFFEIGFLFEKTHTRKFQALQMFAYSIQIKNLDGIGLMQLPEPKLFKVLCTSSASFLSKANLSMFGEDRKLDAYLIRVSKNETFVLMLSLADPWAQLRIEALQKTLMKIIFE